MALAEGALFVGCFLQLAKATVKTKKKAKFIQKWIFFWGSEAHRWLVRALGMLHEGSSDFGWDVNEFVIGGGDEHEGLISFAEEAACGVVNFVFEGNEFAVVGSDADFDADGFKLAGFADELVFKGAREDVVGGGFEVKFWHDAVEEELARFANPHGIHSEVNVADGVSVCVSGDEGMNKPFAFEVATDVLESGADGLDSSFDACDDFAGGGSGS